MIVSLSWKQIGLVLGIALVCVYAFGFVLLGRPKVGSRVGYLTLLCGLRRHGKTLFATRRAAMAIKAGVPVYANFAIEGATLIESWEQVCLAPRGTLVLLDEVHQWCPARAGHTLRPIAGWYIAQCGKLDHEVYIIAQHPNQVAGIVRDQVNEIIHCRRMFGRHRAASYDPQQFGKKDAKPLWTWWYTVRGPAAKVYDTKALVPPERTRRQSADDDLIAIERVIHEIKIRDGHESAPLAVDEIDHLSGWLAKAGMAIHPLATYSGENANGPQPQISTPEDCDPFTDDAYAT